MTRKEAIRQADQRRTLLDLGFSESEAEALRRISNTLHRWSELECNGDIERDETRADKPFRSFAANGGKHYAYPVRDMEAGALRRLEKMFAAHAPLRFYVQGDPRGCALYILRPEDSPVGQEDGHYSRGIAVY